MVPKTPSKPFLETRRFATFSTFFLSDVTPGITHWRADVRIGGKLKMVPSGMRLEFGLARSPGNTKVSF
jgi:hypothetical protein